MWFQLIISARTFYMASLPEKDAEEDHGDVGLTISNNGQAYPLKSVFSSQRTETRGEPWCPCQWPPILSHEDGPRQGKATSFHQKRSKHWDSSMRQLASCLPTRVERSLRVQEMTGRQIYVSENMLAALQCCFTSWQLSSCCLARLVRTTGIFHIMTHFQISFCGFRLVAFHISRI